LVTAIHIGSIETARTKNTIRNYESSSKFLVVDATGAEHCYTQASNEHCVENCDAGPVVEQFCDIATFRPIRTVR
jgi:hypothetical protein